MGRVLLDGLWLVLVLVVTGAGMWLSSSLALYLNGPVWLAWVLGGTRLRAPPIEVHDPSEAELVRSSGGLIARTVASWHTASAMFEHFFLGVARSVRGADRAAQWTWLERHAGILPQELDQLKKWYAAAHAMQEVPLVPLRNLLDQLERRLKS